MPVGASSSQQSGRSNDLRAHIIETAGSLFYEKGIRAVGVDEIIAAAQIAKATLYRHFSGKEDLIVAYLQNRSDRLSKLLAASTDPGLAPVDRVLAVFAHLDQRLSLPDYRGCAFLLAVSEHGDIAAVRDIARSYKTFVRDHFAHLLGDAGRGDLPDQLALLYEGALATAVVRPEAEPGRIALACAAALLAVLPIQR